MRLTRRRLLKSGVAGLFVGTAPTLLSTTASAAEYTNEPASDRVVLGFTVARSGAFADEGADQLRGFELAVEHLNGTGDAGMLGTMQPSSLQGNGILGRRVEYVVGDTRARVDDARAEAERLIDEEGAVMISGGSSSGVAVAMQELCQQKGVMFMAGLTHSNDTTGQDATKNGFRHFINAQMSGTALSRFLVNQYGADRSVYYLTADYNWGYSNQAIISGALEPDGWNTVANVLTPLSQTDFSEYLEPVAASGADVLVLSMYGANLVNAMASVVASGLPDHVASGNQFVIAAPLITRLMARGLGQNGQHLYSTMNWHWSLDDAGSEAFVASFGRKYGFPPSAAAHTCYVQTLQYADACERAGTFDPCLVISELEGHAFTGTGNGSAVYRASDHQCFKDVLIGKGKPGPASDFDLLEVVGTVPASEITYPSNLFNASPGECSNTSEAQEGVDDPDASGGGIEETGASDSMGENSTSTRGNSGGGAVSAGFLAGLLAAGLKRAPLNKDHDDTMAG